MQPDDPGRDSISNIRVFVHWLDSQTIFAGEEVKCAITFKNVTSHITLPAGQHATPAQHSRLIHSDRPPKQLPSRTKTTASLTAPFTARGHSSSVSSTVPSVCATPHNCAGSVQQSPNGVDSHSPHHGRGHKHSVSVLSVQSTTTTIDKIQSDAGSTESKRPARGHGRASSLQIVSCGVPLNGLRSASQLKRQKSSSSSPRSRAAYEPERSTLKERLPKVSTAPNTPGHAASVPFLGASSELTSSYQLPATEPPLSGSQSSSATLHDLMSSPTPTVGKMAHGPSQRKDPTSRSNEHGVAAPAARILLANSVAGTPRSSGEFYSLSNNSSETLASDFVTQQPLRTHGKQPHAQRTSSLGTQHTPKPPEMLMMGYAQVQGSFTLDGSLVNLDPFEQVKRKAVVGENGGGVIGLETGKRDHGIFKSFGWGGLTSSIGEFLGGGELSSIREMRGIASSKSVPLLSTPQSILFVDLQLAPGESRTYEYALTLPKGLPPTHRGKAIKISYRLVIGTQRPGGAKEQQVKSVDIPFRLLGSVNSRGEILGHDLMSPYIILRDAARVRRLDKAHQHGQTSPKLDALSSSSTFTSFLSYADQLLAQSRNGTDGLLSPTYVPPTRQQSSYSFFDEAHPLATTAKEAIDLAILRSNVTGVGQQSANRFEIARNGRRVGVAMLARPAYRLGEVVHLAVDFAGAEIPCYAVHAALEASETVDPSLALRSEASVHRVTRKVHVGASDAALYARRVVFNPTIPMSATPEFFTSGVSLEWKVCLEFAVLLAEDAVVALQDGHGNERDGTERRASSSLIHAHGLHQRQHGLSPHPLLEEISRDDCGGLVLVAAENLTCESFEVAVPLRVYGAVCDGLERLERDEAAEQGFVV